MSGTSAYLICFSSLFLLLALPNWFCASAYDVSAEQAAGKEGKCTRVESRGVSRPVWGKDGRVFACQVGVECAKLPATRAFLAVCPTVEQRYLTRSIDSSASRGLAAGGSSGLA